MKKVISFVVFFAIFLLFSPVYAGHDFMNEMRKAATLTKKESCSNGRTTIEYLSLQMMDVKLLLTLVVIEPDEKMKKSEFYKEENKDFYSTIFYKLFLSSHDKEEVSYFVKSAESGDLESISDFLWFKVLRRADYNAARSLMGQPGSDCKIVNQ